MANIQQLAQIGTTVKNAVVFDFKNWRDAVNADRVRTVTMHGDALPQTVTQLFTLLQEREINYLLVGGIALLFYIEGRNTEDIDLIVAVSELSRLPEISLTSQDDNFARGKFGDLKIDFLLTRNPLFETVRQRYATTRHFMEQDIACATVEGLLLLKLYALPVLYRMGNFARVGLYENDIATLLHDYHPALPPLFDELANHLGATDLQAVRDVVAEIEQRIQRFQNRSDS